MAAAVALHQDDLIAFSQGQPGANKLEIEFTAVGLIDKQVEIRSREAILDIIQAEFVENLYGLRGTNLRHKLQGRYRDKGVQVVVRVQSHRSA